MIEKGFAGLPTDSSTINTPKLVYYYKTVLLQKSFQVENYQCAFRSLYSQKEER